MVIKEQLYFVIEEGENMFDKEFISDFRFIFDVNVDFDKNQVIDYNSNKYISGSALKGMLRNYFLNYEQRNINDDIKDFFDWLLDNLNNDIKAIKENNYEWLYEEYCKTKKSLKDKKDKVSNYFYLNFLDYDSIQRLKKIFLNYKEEYEIFKNYKKDIVFYNDLLGWYKDIPDDVIMFIENLYKKQFENYIDTYITESKQMKMLNCDDSEGSYAA
jgi:CRISPR/Cas system CSM-associated protein Csm5 (group 7 of RAMP superfamily)